MRHVSALSHWFLFMTLVFVSTVALGQTTSDASDSGQSQLEQLVGPIALYPDDLLSIILPASTYPLQVVEANRWIQENKDNAEAKPKESWDDSIKALLNYPDVLGMMSGDLEWTAAVGEAVATDQTAVMDSVQSFRRKAEGAGNLKSDDKQVIVIEEEVVKIVQADPQVIYVPQYEPQVVIVEQPAPVYPTYYPTPYPVYYYPYPPGAAFAAGFFWGAVTVHAFDWFGGGIHNDIDIDIDRDIDRDRNVDRDSNIESRSTNIDRSQSQQMAKENRTGWQSKQNPADVRSGRTSSATASSWGKGQAAKSPTARAGTSQQPRASSANRNSSGRSNYQNANQHSSAARKSTPSNNTFSGMSSGRSTNAHSARGAASRGMRGGGRRR